VQYNQRKDFKVLKNKHKAAFFPRQLNRKKFGFVSLFSSDVTQRTVNSYTVNPPGTEGCLGKAI